MGEGEAENQVVPEEEQQPMGDEGINGAEHDMVNGDANGAQASQANGVAGERLPNKTRVTTPYLTKYERARILGTRALQIRCAETRLWPSLLISYPRL